MKLSALLLCVCVCFSFFSQNCHAQHAVFEFTFTGTTPDAEAAITKAGEIWGDYLISDIPVKVTVHFQLLTPGLLGITFPNGIKNFAGAPLEDIWYPTALANSIAATELNAGDADMEIYLNSTAAWYFGLDGEVPAGKYDLVTIALHEMGHGLGIISLADKISAEGSFGLITAEMFSPLTTSFTWPDLDTLPSIFDTYLEDGAGTKLITYTYPSSELGLVFTGNDVWYNSPSSIVANGGERVKMYAPSVYALGSSITHLDESTFPAGSPNELMTPNGTPGNANQEPGGIVLGILQDIGWTVDLPMAVNEIVNAQLMHIYPNPANDVLNIQTVNIEHATLEILDITGELVLFRNNVEDLSALPLQTLSPGIYFIKLSANDNVYKRSFVKL